MDNIALFFKDVFVYWHGIFMGAALLVTLLLALLFCAALQKNRTGAIWDTALLALPIGFVLSRLLYCVFNLDEEFRTFGSVFHLTDGGYALYGAILGTLLAMWILHLRRRDAYSAGAAGDCLAVGASLGIAVGRMSAYFSCDNYGIEVFDKRFQFFPVSVYDAANSRWVLATFTLEAVISVVIFVVLGICMIRRCNEKTGMTARHGDIALLFLLLHGASQGVFDSMHWDALKLSDNGFIRIQQILGAVFLAVVTGILIVRSVKKNGFRYFQPLAGVVCLGMIGLALFIELDRISNTNWYHHHICIFFTMLTAAVSGVMLWRTTLDSPET